MLKIVPKKLIFNQKKLIKINSEKMLIFFLLDILGQWLLTISKEDL